MKKQYFVWYNSEEEKKRLLTALYEKGCRHPDYFDPEKQSTHQTLIIEPASGYIGPVRPMIGAAAVSSGARFYTVDELLFLLENGFEKDLPRVIFHVPHDGTEFPKELMESVIIPQERFLPIHEIMRDRNVSELVPKPFHFYRMLIQFPVSRLLCDVERFIGPEEAMEKYGMGFCYEKAFDGTVLKNVTEEAEQRALKYYRKHHAQLDRLAKEHPWLLMIDLHSFSEETVPADLAASGPLPEICIGTDPVCTPKHLTESAKRLFSGAGYAAAENYPFEGCMAPNAVLKGRKGCRCAGIMIEVNKRVYLDESGTVKEIEAERIREILKALILEYEKEALDLTAEEIESYNDAAEKLEAERGL